MKALTKTSEEGPTRPGNVLQEAAPDMQLCQGNQSCSGDPENKRCQQHAVGMQVEPVQETIKVICNQQYCRTWGCLSPQQPTCDQMLVQRFKFNVCPPEFSFALIQFCSIPLFFPFGMPCLPLSIVVLWTYVTFILFDFYRGSWLSLPPISEETLTSE